MAGSDAGWDVPARAPGLPADELHVWRIPLDLGDAALVSLHQTLDPDERARADRFRMPRDRRRFVAARGTLRLLLGQALGRDPADIAFAYGPQGKPSLIPSPAAPRLAFNVSHSGDLGLIALRWGANIGVDIERIRDDWDWEGVAGRFFCAGEIAWLRALPIVEQNRGFFTLWTRKEAYLKARGEGLWHDLGRFDVTQNPVREAGPADAADEVHWLVEDLSPGGHCQAAVCVPGPLPIVRTWQWEPPGA